MTKDFFHASGELQINKQVSGDPYLYGSRSEAIVAILQQEYSIHLLLAFEELNLFSISGQMPMILFRDFRSEINEA